MYILLWLPSSPAAATPDFQCCRLAIIRLMVHDSYIIWKYTDIPFNVTHILCILWHVQSPRGSSQGKWWEPHWASHRGRIYMCTVVDGESKKADRESGCSQSSAHTTTDAESDINKLMVYLMEAEHRNYRTELHQPLKIPQRRGSTKCSTPPGSKTQCQSQPWQMMIWKWVNKTQWLI